MTGAEYAAIVQAFTHADPDAAPPSFRSVGRALNHSARTVAQIYEHGWHGMPSVREVLEERRRRELARRLRARERVETYLKGLHARMLGGLGRALAEVPVDLQPIRTTKDARQAAMALRELAELADELHGTDERESPPSVSVNVNIGTDDSRYVGKTPEHIATMKSAEQTMLRHPSLFTPEHEAQTAELIARRWLLTHPERENEDERDTEQRRLLQSMYPTESDDPAVRAALEAAAIAEEDDEDD